MLQSGRLCMHIAIDQASFLPTKIIGLSYSACLSPQPQQLVQVL
jgi:hypothetical protein